MNIRKRVWVYDKFDRKCKNTNEELDSIKLFIKSLGCPGLGHHMIGMVIIVCILMVWDFSLTLYEKTRARLKVCSWFRLQC